MSHARPTDVVCVCGFRGSVSARGKCPRCSAVHTERLTSARLATLSSLAHADARCQPPRIDPAMRVWLVARGLIEPVGPRVAPSSRRRSKWPVRRHVVTEGCRVRFSDLIAWVGPLDRDLAPGGDSLRVPVPYHRWPHGPPASHGDACRLLIGGVHCTCEARLSNIRPPVAVAETP